MMNVLCLCVCTFRNKHTLLCAGRFDHSWLGLGLGLGLGLDLGYSGGLCGPPWVPKGGQFGVRVSSCHTHRMRGGPTSGGGPLVVCDKKLFSCAVFCAVPSPQQVAPRP